MVDISIKGEIVSDDCAWIYDWYGMAYTSPKQIINALKNANGEDVNLIINSGGGSVYAGCEIYNTIMNYKGNTTASLYGICASIAGIIALGANKIIMSPLSQFMIHNVSCGAEGDYRTMESTAETLKKWNSTIANAIKRKTNLSDEEIKEIMDNETWYTADEALEIGLVDEIMYSEDKVNSNLLNMLKNKSSTFCNSVALSNLKIEDFKNYKPVNIQPINKDKVDFFMQKKLKAQLELIKLKGSVE